MTFSSFLHLIYHNLTLPSDGKYIFEMRSRKGASFIALALSHNAKMGSDSVVECVKDYGRVKLFNSLTTDNPPYESRRDAVVS
jgi:hypothetical protein